jgi:hypothetical protein
MSSFNQGSKDIAVIMESIQSDNHDKSEDSGVGIGNEKE